MAKSAGPLEELVQSIYRRNDEYSELTGAEPNQALGRPATESNIRAVENKYKIRLPNDYRAFLLLHDGWKGFDEELALLSTREMLGSDVSRWILELQTSWSKGGGRTPGEGFVIAAAKGQTAFHLFDRTKKRRDAAYDVVKWNDEEVARYRSFTDYLRGTLRLLEELIEDEK